MARTTRQLPLEFGGCGSLDGGGYEAVRAEARQRVVRMVEFTPFPRVACDLEKRVAFTRDESESGMCLGTDSAEAVGGLLRVIVRGVDGQPTLDCLARVVWCEPRPEGRYWIGLAVVDEARPRMLKVRHTRRQKLVAVTA
ncbi:MAG: PilZ domain-containing protein [Myxococcota bacterium]